MLVNSGFNSKVKELWCDLGYCSKTVVVSNNYIRNYLQKLKWCLKHSGLGLDSLLLLPLSSSSPALLKLMLRAQIVKLSHFQIFSHCSTDWSRTVMVIAENLSPTHKSSPLQVSPSYIKNSEHLFKCVTTHWHSAITSTRLAIPVSPSWVTVCVLCLCL